MRMPIAPALALATLAALPALAGTPPAPARLAADGIDEMRCRAHVDFLASDLLEGRSTPSRGLDVAATYIVSQFERRGLSPAGDQGGWFQSFPILREVRLTASTLEVGGRALALEKEWTPLPMTRSGAAEGGLVFAGYGITTADGAYDDYAGLDVAGKVVLVLRHEPNEKERGRRLSRDSFFATKIANAAKHGAAAILIANDDPANHAAGRRRGGAAAARRGELEWRWPNTGGTGMGGGEEQAGAIPAVQVTREAAAALLGGRDLATLQKEIEAARAPRSFAVEGVTARLEVKVERIMGEARNVVAVLPGSDPDLAGEAVVVGAHYDHVGVEGEDGPSFYGQIGGPVGGDRIHNGADDNASGTAALLEVARAFAESGLRPRRSVIFVAFAGEELGLLGSQHYVAHPAIPMAKTVAMVNLDMVGRNAPGELFVGGKPDAALSAALDDANGVIGFKTAPITDRATAGASDHASFEAAKVPTLFFFSGDHADYHRVTDEAARIDGAKIARVARLALLTAAGAADAVRPGERAPTAGPAGGGPGRLF
jgi:hypothetical protein